MQICNYHLRKRAADTNDAHIPRITRNMPLQIPKITMCNKLVDRSSPVPTTDPLNYSEYALFRR